MLVSLRGLFWVQLFSSFLSMIFLMIYFAKKGIFADDTTFYSSVGKDAGRFEKVEMAANQEADFRYVTE